MTRFALLILILLLFFRIPLHAQNGFYDYRNIPEINITFSQGNWEYLLDSLFQYSGGTARLKGDISIDGHLYHNVGIRYKGYSSWNEGEIKNPFNIELDYTIKNQNHLGFTTIKLSNVIHDPSFVREVLGYEIARKYLPSSRANFANLYINDTLIGLYSNVESVDRKFIAHHYPSNDKPFFKGEPDQLIFPFGQNANLANSHGTDSIAYVPYYKLESDYGWEAIYKLIYILNVTPDSLPAVLNIDRTLWMHAFNYASVNLDSYIAYAQNYYMYMDDLGRFNPVIWDLNMSFGSFRESDASTHFQGLSITEAKTLDPLQHLGFSISPRPLMKKLFANETYRRMYLAHMRTIIDENFRNGLYYQRAREIQAVIAQAVQADTNKFYSNSDFINNLDTTVGGSGTMIQYPGIKNLMEGRIAWLDAYPGFSGQPLITAVGHYPETPVKKTECWIMAGIQKSEHAWLYYRNKTEAAFTPVEMLDDGKHNDGSAGDQVFGAGLLPEGSVVQYFIYAENDSAGSFSPERAAYEFYQFQPLLTKGEIRMNEIMAVSDLKTADQDGEYDPWIEFFNTSAEDLKLKGSYLSDDEGNPHQWEFGDTTIMAGGYLVVWADGDTSQKGLHTGFNLSGNFGFLVFSNSSGEVMDSLTYGRQISGKTLGRYPNAYGTFTFMLPTFGKANFMGTSPETGFLIYPNPADQLICIEYKNNGSHADAEIFSYDGKLILQGAIGGQSGQVTGIITTLDISGLNKGVYLLKLRFRDEVVTKKFVKL